MGMLTDLVAAAAAMVGTAALIVTTIAVTAAAGDWAARRAGLVWDTRTGRYAVMVGRAPRRGRP